ncbi:diguanylate cyclase [Variovorax sp. YR752]|uniref:sensor domain-containing diguanylate cyclase n=1 Tax=Variovorax sp. YR752 TaxID=1884383 RepID=UPI0031380F7E
MDFLWRRLAGAWASIKLRVTLSAIAAMAAGVLLTALLLVQRAERDTLTHHRDRELAEVVHMAGLLSDRVVERQRALRASGDQIDPAMVQDAARLKNFLDNKPLLRGMFSNIFVAAADGRMVAYADDAGVRRPDINLGDREYFRRALRDQRPVISEPVPGRVSGEPVIVFVHPLVRDGAVYGALGGALRLASRDLLGEIAGISDGEATSLTVVTDAQGHVLAHPMRRNLLQPVVGEPRLAEAHEHWAASGSPVEPAGLMLQQSGELVSVAGVAGPDWLVWRAMPEGELLGPLHAARREALLAAAGLVALLSLVILAIVSWLLRPLGQLAGRAQHLFDGSLDIHDGWPNAGGEIERLSRVLRHVGAERAQLESFNGQVLRKLSSVMAAAPVGICFTRDKRFELVSEEFCRLFGRSEADLLGQPASCIYASNEDYMTLGPQVVAEFKQGRAYIGEWQMLRADGSCFWGQLRGRPVADGDPAAGTIWTIADISEQVATREQLEWSATHDVLTGLANRKLLAQRLERVLEASPRSMPAEVVMIDLDHFKPINDRAGHAAGDAMLKAVAAAITSRVRATDLVARLGGDEFALLLERCPHDTALRIAENVREAISAIALSWEGQMLRVGASLGVASLSEETASAADWLAEADAACYAAKSAGRGSVQAAKRPALRIVG